MSILKRKKEEESTEQKIITAARKLFTQKGFDAVKTRDIAEEAGINLALLNYYFRSKEKLFEIIMGESLETFFLGFSNIVNDEKTTYTKKIEQIVSNYIDMLLKSPDTPLFVMNQVRANPKRIEAKKIFMNSYFMKQLQAGIKTGEIAPMNVVNLMLNIVSLSIFPFIGRPIFQAGEGSITDEQFIELMMERKKMIPKWIEATLKVK
ncbi:MAG TPA: TetR/AcrR family transcriptional regulator [Bacteroidia bacterium]|nr:TetR/AcrR family transcriptional regulator [Bacteroidia bacterium]